MGEKHRAILKIGHINTNGIAGYKFHAIKRWSLSGRLDILIISDYSFKVSACPVMIETFMVMA